MKPRLLALTLGLAACAPEFDPERVPADPGTFGQRVVTLMCKRLAYQADPTDVSGSKYREACKGGTMPTDAPPTLIALAANRDRLVTAIDFVVPESVYDPLQTYLTSAPILALYDDDTMSKSIESIGNMLKEMGGDFDAMAAFERMGTRNGYRPPAQAIGPAAPLTNSPHIRSVMDSVLPSIVEGGSSKAEWDALVAAMSFTLVNAAPQGDGTGSTAAKIANEFLLTEHADLGEATPLWMVRRDVRGIAKIALVANEIPAPFVDRNGDKLADVDAQGNYLAATGGIVAAPSPFSTSGDIAMRDADGRALSATGAPLYDYFDITKTLLGSMSNDQVALLDPATTTAIDFFRGAALLLGDRVDATRTMPNGSSIAYQGYDTQNSPLLDMAHAFVQLLRDPNIIDTLALTETLMEQHRPVVSRLLEAAITVARMADEHPEAEILASAPLWDDLRPHIQKLLANPDLTRDVMRALEKPEMRQLLLRFRDWMKHKDRFDIASDQSLTGTFSTLVDRTQPDIGFNRSVWERMLHLISDANGAVECSKENATIWDPTRTIALAQYPQPCTFFRVPNMAVFFLQSIVYAKDANGMLLCETTAGAFGNTQPGATPEACEAMGRRPRRKANFNYNWTLAVRTLIVAQGGDAFLETRSTIPGFRTHPTSEGLTRALLLRPRPQSLQDTSDPAHDKWGADVATKHVGTLPVWERDNFIPTIRPLLQAFADHNEEQIFVDMISVLHKHWPSTASTDTQHTNPAGPNYTMASNGVSYEPLVMRVFESDLWPALTEHAAELNAVTVNAKPFTTVARNAGYFLMTPLAGLTDRQGNASTTTPDGMPVPVMSPWHLIADAYLAKRARLAATSSTLWPDSTRELVDVMFRSDKVGNTWTFRSPHIAAATRATVKLVRDRLQEHIATGDRAEWVATDLPKKIDEFLTHPLFAAAADFVESQTASGAPRTALDNLLFSVFDRNNAADAYATMRVGSADLIQLAPNDVELVPIARMVARLIASDKTYLPTQLALLHRMHLADVDATLTNVVARLFQQHDSTKDPGIPAISAIADGVGDVDRVEPGPPAPWSSLDYAHVFGSVGVFMQEEARGMPRFVTIIKGREL